MMKSLRALALAGALAGLPACAALRLENPVAAARTNDQRAHALISTYAATLEEAADLVRDPATPAAVKQGLARAERIATPAVETLKVALVAYLQADADLRALPASASAAERAGATVQAASLRLQEAIVAAQAPVEALRAALKAKS